MRYSGYKLPISIFKSKAQYKAIENSELSPEVKKLILQQINSADAEEDDLDAELAAESVDNILVEESSSAGVEETPKRGRKSPKRKETVASALEAREEDALKERLDADQVMNQRYVNLVDVFPPIPEKGKFNIETIKDSPYFFS